MEAEEFKVSFKGILFSRRRVRNEIKWKLEKTRAWEASISPGRVNRTDRFRLVAHSDDQAVTGN